MLVQTLSTRDSIAIARMLSDVADEAADGARMIRRPESGGGQEPGRGRVRLDTEVREQAERMADALDRTLLSEVDQAASNALKAADEEKIVADRQLDLFGNPSRLGGEIAQVREQLERLRQAALQLSHERL